MKEQKQIHFDRIATAIQYIQQHYKAQPTLEEVARQVHLSPQYFQRMFKEWAGVSPKKFLQFISVNHAKQILQKKKTSLLDAAYETGLSGAGRLHDLFLNIEGMTPGEYKNKGASLHIHYSFAESPFGEILVASTAKGICYLSFVDGKKETLAGLKNEFRGATFEQQTDNLQQKALNIFQQDWDNVGQVKLHLKGSDFQLKVWEALLKIPAGSLSTYGQLAQNIGRPKASRTVGTAIGKNPVAFLIPCHRVIRSSGVFGEYRWGSSRKTAMIGWEGARN